MDSLNMESIARVSAVFLLVGLVWVAGVLGDEGKSRGYDGRTQTKQKAGVGTEMGLPQGDSGMRRESPGAGKVPEAKGISGAYGDVAAVFRDVEAGWRSATPKPFEKYLRKGKVRLDFGEGGPRGGLFARSQAYYLIADYLRGTQTLDAGLVKISEGVKDATKPYALVERIFRDRNGMSRREVVFVSLALEDSLWAISELRVIPAK